MSDRQQSNLPVEIKPRGRNEKKISRERPVLESFENVETSPAGPAVRDRSFRYGTALLIFIATLAGSLLGAAADLSEALSSADDFQALFYPDLCVAGSDTVLSDDLGLATDWEEQFEQNNEVKLRFDATGSGAGVRKAIDGECVHVLAMSEAMTEEQHQNLRNAGLDVSCSAEIGYDIIAFVTDVNNDIPSLLNRNLTSLLAGNVEDWRHLGGRQNQAIFVFARPGSGTTLHVLNQYTGYEDPVNLPQEGNFLECDDNMACLNDVLSTPGSLYWVSVSWMKTQPEQFLRVIPILRFDSDPLINPLRDAVQLNSYPQELVRPLYMYVLEGEGISDDDRARGQWFLEYVRGVDGQSLLSEKFFYPHFNRPTDRVTVEFPEGQNPYRVTGPRDICN